MAGLAGLTRGQVHSLRLNGQTWVQPPPHELPKGWNWPIVLELYFDRARLDAFVKSAPWKQKAKRGRKVQRWKNVVNGAATNDEAIQRLRKDGFPSARRYQDDDGRDRVLLEEGYNVALRTFQNARTDRRVHRK